MNNKCDIEYNNYCRINNDNGRQFSADDNESSDSESEVKFSDDDNIAENASVKGEEIMYGEFLLAGYMMNICVIKI